MSNPDTTAPARRMNYEMAGELPGGGFYQVRIGGPLPSKMLRHVEALVRMAAEWLEEDERSDLTRGFTAEDIADMEAENGKRI